MAEMVKNLYCPEFVKLTNIRQDTPSIFTLRLALKEEVFLDPGQFGMITLHNYKEFSAPIISEPGQHIQLEIAIDTITYPVKDFLLSMNQGDIVGFRGPYGNTLPIKDYFGKNIYVLSTGFRIAHNITLINKLVKENERMTSIKVIHLAEIYDEQYRRLEYESWQKQQNIECIISLTNHDSQWAGHSGSITDILTAEGIDRDGIFIISADNYIEIIDLLIRNKVQLTSIFINMFDRISCAVGKCSRCHIGDYRVCKNGPFMKLSNIYNSIFSRV